MRNDLRTRLRVQLATSVLMLHEARRLDLVDALTESGVNPRDIPWDCDLRRDGLTLHLDRYVRGDGGGILSDGSEPVIEELSVDMKRMPHWIP